MGNGFQIVTTSLPGVQVGASYDVWLQASGGNNNFVWSLNLGNQLSPGLSLGSEGHIYGTPTAAGTATFSVHAEDGNGHSANQNLTITINAVALQVTTGTLPKGYLGGAYTAQLGVNGGHPPYQWSLALGSAGLPPGLFLNSNGLISGNPSASGTFNFIVNVTDAMSASANGMAEIVLYPRPTLSSPTQTAPGDFEFLVHGLAGQNYTIQASSDLRNWSSIQVTNAPSDTFSSNPGHQEANNYRFYRVMVGP